MIRISARLSAWGGPDSWPPYGLPRPGFLRRAAWSAFGIDQGAGARAAWV